MENKGIIAGVIVIIFLGVILVVTNRPVENSRSYDTTTQTAGLTELIKETVKPGTGDREAKTGDKIQVHYVGTLKNGTKFDSSRDRGQPFEFTIGQGVIQGWSQGTVGMKLGEVRKLSIPANLGYGSNGTSGIPGNSDLYFEIELLGFLN